MYGSIRREKPGVCVVCVAPTIAIHNRSLRC